MQTPRSFTSASDERLIELINSSTRRVFFVAPGLSEPVALALANAWSRLGSAAVEVVLDIDPEICRIGYGTIEGIKTIRDAALEAGAYLGQHRGIRIGLLIYDDQTIIFSPSPLSIENTSNDARRPNAIMLDTVPAELAQDVGQGSTPELERTVGLDQVKPYQIERTERDLIAAPPVKFDLARRVRVFTSRFQFIEIKVNGCFISRKKVPIPSALIGLANRKEVEHQFHAHFDLVQQGQIEVKTDNGVITERSIQEQRKNIERSYLIALKDYGQVVLRAMKGELEAELVKLQSDVKVFADGAKADLQIHMDKRVQTLTNSLFPNVKQNPPNSYIKFRGRDIPDDLLREMLEEDIKEAFGTAESLVEDMTVKWVFKDVAYESLVDEKFLTIAETAIPGFKKMYEEFDAVREAEGRAK